MRKAFDANVPKLKPRLKTGFLPPNTAAAVAEPEADLAPEAVADLDHAELVASVTPVPFAVPPEVAEAAAALKAAAETYAPPVAARPSPLDKLGMSSGRAEERAARVEPVPARGEPVEPRAVAGPVRPTAARIAAALPQEPNVAGDDVRSRKDRLDKIKRRVAEAAKPSARVEPTPADPARAAESVLGLVRELEAELGQARLREEALRGDLDEARGELARAAQESRGTVERLGAAEKELDEKRTVLADLLGEMDALESERDEAVRRAQALSALDEERARLLDEVTRRADDEARARGEREAEVERLSEELRAGAADGARLRAAVGELARERDQLSGELDRLRAERDDLSTAKRALEQVHAALAQARARLG